jgi:hypothetical protein
LPPVVQIDPAYVGQFAFDQVGFCGGTVGQVRFRQVGLCGTGLGRNAAGLGGAR